MARSPQYHAHNILPVAAGQSNPVSFSIQIPYQFNKPLTYRIVAKTGNLSDGEEAMLPVVSNRMLVTETLPLPVRGNAYQKIHVPQITAVVAVKH